MLKRIESTDKLRVQREQAAQKAAEAAKPKPRKGLSPEMVARIDEAVLGKARWPVRTVTSVPIDPWNPEESPSSRSIPHNPGESRPENDPPVSRPQPEAHPPPVLLLTQSFPSGGENTHDVAPATVAPARAMRHTVARSGIANVGER